jgi:hypothetical protein
MTRFVQRSYGWNPWNPSRRLVPPLSTPTERSLTSVRRPDTTARRCLAAALFLALAACSGSGSDRSVERRPANADATTTTGAAATSTTASTTTPEAAVIDAYLAYWRAVNAYGSETGPFDAADFKARFSPVATGAQYDSLFTSLQVDRAQGLVYRGGERDQFRPKVVELAGDRAVVEDCADDTGGVFDTKTSTFTENTTPGQHSRIRAVLHLEAGTWKVSTETGGDQRCTP